MLKNNKYREAKGIAQKWDEAKKAGNSHIEDMCAEISKKHADYLYSEKNRADLALDSYVDTIGYLNPSYVIQRYMELQYLPYLLKYLEKLVEDGDGSRTSMNNQEYTALLVTCYIKLGKIDKVQQLILTQTERSSSTSGLYLGNDSIKSIIEACT